MPRLGRNLDQWFQNKPSPLHSRMRNLQARLIHHRIPKQQDVDINIARTFVTHAQASHGRLDLQRKLKQLSRRLVGCNRYHAVQKPGLIPDIYRLGLVQRGDRQHSARRG